MYFFFYSVRRQERGFRVKICVESAELLERLCVESGNEEVKQHLQLLSLTGKLPWQQPKPPKNKNTTGNSGKFKITQSLLSPFILYVLILDLDKMK